MLKRSNMMTLARDDSEDHIASNKLMNLVGEEMLKLKVPQTLKELQSNLIKPEGNITFLLSFFLKIFVTFSRRKFPK